MGVFDGAKFLGEGIVRSYDGYRGTYCTRYNIYVLKGRIIAAKERTRLKRVGGSWLSPCYVTEPTGDYESYVCSEKGAIEMLVDAGVPLADFIDKLPSQPPQNS